MTGMGCKFFTNGIPFLSNILMKFGNMFFDSEKKREGMKNKGCNNQPYIDVIDKSQN